MPPVPFWDTTWLSALLLALGDTLILGAAYIAFHVYKLQQDAVNRQRQQASLNHLEGVRASLTDWHDSFFSTSYKGKLAAERAQFDYDQIRKHRSFMQNYRVSIDPVASLIALSGDTWPFSQRTVRAANIALSRMTVFNQLVQQQTDFNVLHAADLRRFGGRDRTPIAEAGFTISGIIHGAIDDASWYHDLKLALDLNIAELWILLAAPPPNRPIRRRIERFVSAMRGDRSVTMSQRMSNPPMPWLSTYA